MVLPGFVQWMATVEEVLPGGTGLMLVAEDLGERLHLSGLDALHSGQGLALHRAALRLAQPDGPLMFFWLACVWCLAHLFLSKGGASRSLRWWAAAGAMLGLGLLSKYTAVLLVAGAGLYVLTRRDQWRWLARPGPYVALAVAALHSKMRGRPRTG